MKTESLVKQFMSRCRHFNGIQHDTCEKGINYRQLVGGPDLGWAIRIPCFAERDTALCSLREFPTQEEAEAHEREAEASFRRMMEELGGGRCPHCHKEVKQKQVGHCVYGTCGHRLYQGKVNPQFAL